MPRTKSPVPAEDHTAVTEQPEPADLTVVGIGASAGGLEALQEFFQATPPDSGVAFVVVQHLSPDYKSLMDELLARHTSMPIFVIEDGMTLRPNTVYLIPPRSDLGMTGNRLRLMDVGQRRGLHLPVDGFFAALAAEKGQSAVGVVLSGTGSDGTLGVRSIKEAGGLIIVQDETTAKFDGMPRSAVSTGLVDYILAPAQMPEAILGYLQHPLVRRQAPPQTPDVGEAEPFRAILATLRESCGVDFSFYKESTVIRRLERRVTINRFNSIEEYASFLVDSEKEKATLFREMLIGVTRFFRDTEAFAALAKRVLPLLALRKQVRIWSAGCSTGEEVYSLAILLHDQIERVGADTEVKIFATDVDLQALEVAGRGLYPESLLADVDPVWIRRYFERVEGGYKVVDSIRRMVVFATHNILKDPPFSKLDLMVCRNLFIYFKPEVQSRLLGAIYHCLTPDGFLFLGSSETLGELAEGFDPIDAKARLYHARAGFTVPLERMLHTGINRPVLETRSGGRSREAQQHERIVNQMLARYLPPSVVVDGNDLILQTVNDVSPYLTIRPGRFSSRIQDHLTQDLGLVVSTVLRRLRAGELEFRLENLVSLGALEGGALSITGYVLDDPRTPCYLVSFVKGRNPPPPPPGAPPEAMGDLYQGRLSDLERELQFTRESLQATVEELETSNEELQSSNEELVASNEELQSTNEELQSVNEELHTVNAEYQSKIEELTNAKNDEANLLKNTDVGALYLDRLLAIRKVTSRVSDLTHIRPSDIGRPLEHLAAPSSYPELLTDVTTVLDTLQPKDREVHGLDGRTYLASVRPYRTEFASVEGVLVTFVDVTVLNEERTLTLQANRRLEEALHLGNMAWWEWDLATGIVTYDPRKATMAGHTPQSLGNTIEAICSHLHPEDYEPTMQSMRDHLEGRIEVWEARYRFLGPDGTSYTFEDRGAITQRDDQGAPLRLVGTIRSLKRPG